MTRSRFLMNIFLRIASIATNEKKEIKILTPKTKNKVFSFIKNESCNMLQKGLEMLCRME